MTVTHDTQADERSESQEVGGDPCGSPVSKAAGRHNALRARRISGGVYMRQEDVVRYLRETAADWAAGSRSEVTIVAVDCVHQIADQLGKVTA